MVIGLIAGVLTCVVLYYCGCRVDKDFDVRVYDMKRQDNICRKLEALREDAQEIGKLQTEINDKLTELLTALKTDTASKDIIDVE